MIIFRSLRGSGVLPAVFKVAGSLGFIGFDTSYIVGGTLHQSFYQLVGLSLNHQKTTNIINKILYQLINDNDGEKSKFYDLLEKTEILNETSIAMYLFKLTS